MSYIPTTFIYMLMMSTALFITVTKQFRTSSVRLWHPWKRRLAVEFFNVRHIPSCDRIQTVFVRTILCHMATIMNEYSLLYSFSGKENSWIMKWTSCRHSHTMEHLEKREQSVQSHIVHPSSYSFWLVTEHVRFRKQTIPFFKITNINSKCESCMLPWLLNIISSLFLIERKATDMIAQEL